MPTGTTSSRRWRCRPRPGDDGVARGADGADRQRSLAGVLHGRRARPLRVHRSRDGSIVSRAGGASSRRKWAPDRTSRRSCTRARRSSRQQSGVFRRARLGPSEERRILRTLEDAAETGPSVAAALTDGFAARDGGTLGPQPRDALRPRARGDRRARARAVRRVVRDVPALGRHRPVAQRDVRRGRGAAALRRVDGLRRAVPAADPSDRPQLPQGPEQFADAGARRSRQPVGDRLGGRRPHGGRAGARHARGLRSLRRRRRARHGLEIALDIAFQASPDHPYVREHPEWFRHRPDGTIKYAENPPKKYQDIYPINFDSDDWPALWHELKGVFEFWIEHGVKIFRVDNPHTKPFHFWEWALGEISASIPDTIFLSEAFTRPKVMRYLAKVGFSQSYTYFTWRNTKAGADGVLHRADPDRRPRVLPAQPVREHARHPARVPAARRAAGLPGAPGARRHARRHLRHLQRLRAGRERAR